MKLELIVVNLLIITISAEEEIHFILDYFLYKNTASVVGFTCNDVKDDATSIKLLSKSSIKAIFGNLKFSALHDLLKTRMSKLGVLFDTRCQDEVITYKLFSEVTQYRPFSELHNWLVIFENLSKVESVIQDENFGLWTDFVAAIGNDYGSYKLYDIYNPHKRRGGKLNVTFMGSWSPGYGFSISLKQSKYCRRADLHGMPWRIGFIGCKYKPKHVDLEDYLQDFEKTGTKDGLSKFGYSVVKYLSEMHNSTLLLTEYPGWKKNDRIGPVTKALWYDDIDFGGTPTSVFSEKLSMVKYVYTCWPFRTCFIFRSPQSQDIKIREIFNPFSTNVWYSYFTMLFLFFIILSINFYFERVQRIIDQYSNSILITIGCICQQATDISMQLFSTRMVFINIMMFSLLIYDYYSASIVSTRLNEQIVKINDSMTSLAMTNLRMASEPMIYFDFFMKERAKDTALFNRTKWQTIPEDQRFIPIDKGILSVKDGGFAYHAHPDAVYPYINRLYENREVCELTEVHLAKLAYRSIAVTYNSSFTEISKIGFLKISEVGIRIRQLKRWTAEKPVCRTDVLSASSTTICEFAPHLILLLIGIVISVILLLLEIFMHADRI